MRPAWTIPQASIMVDTTTEWLRAAEELSCNLTPSGVYRLQRLINMPIALIASYLVGLDMSTEQGTHIFSSLVHTGTIRSERRAIDNHGRCAQLMQSLSSKLFDQGGFVGQAQECMGSNVLRR